jgi:hypothetical protein
VPHDVGDIPCCKERKIRNRGKVCPDSNGTRTWTHWQRHQRQREGKIKRRNERKNLWKRQRNFSSFYCCGMDLLWVHANEKPLEKENCGWYGQQNNSHLVVPLKQLIPVGISYTFHSADDGAIKDIKLYICCSIMQEPYE